MRETYHKQLEALHSAIIRMGALCEEAIAAAVKGLLEEDPALREKAVELEGEIDLKEREIEALCVRLLLREQPVAGDLRRITAAQKVIADMERVGDQALNIAELSPFIDGSGIKSGVHIGSMARGVVKMLSDSVDAFVESDLEKARAVIAYDRVVDDLFARIKKELVGVIVESGPSAENSAEAWLDILMIAKYLERIGDHAQNIAEGVKYSITGSRK
jgi:phosphate transport system protein